MENWECQKEVMEKEGLARGVTQTDLSRKKDWGKKRMP
jgi:hypothetical protein